MASKPATKEHTMERLEEFLEAAKADNEDFECLFFWTVDGDNIHGNAYAGTSFRDTITGALIGELRKESDNEQQEEV